MHNNDGSPANISWLRLHRNLFCIRFLSPNTPSCIHKSVFMANIKIWNQNLDSYFKRNIMDELHKSDCETFLLISDRFDHFKTLFPYGRLRKQFFPFTRIFIVQIKTKVNDDLYQFNDNELAIILEHGLEVYLIDGWQPTDNIVLKFNTIKNVLTQTMLNISQEYHEHDLKTFYGTFREHPFLDLKNTEKAFSVSLFNCSPSVIHFDDAMDKRYVFKFAVLRKIDMDFNKNKLIAEWMALNIV